MAPATPWEHGRFDARRGPKRLLFGRMYEDSAIEDDAFPTGRPVFCIASAGCTAIRLAARHDVTAVDINPVQLAYAEARAAGAPMRRGFAERLMDFGRLLLVPAGWRRRTLASFLALDDPVEQIAFWRRHLDTRGFRAATGLLFSVTGLRTVYAAPLLACLPARFGRVIRARLERTFAAHPNRTNVYVRALLAGELAEEPRAADLRPIRFACADAAAYLEQCAPGSFAGFALSNILDGADDAYRTRLVGAVRHAATDDAVVVRRSFSEPAAGAPTNLAARDRSALWGIVDVRPAAAPERSP